MATTTPGLYSVFTPPSSCFEQHSFTVSPDGSDVVSEGDFASRSLNAACYPSIEGATTTSGQSWRPPSLYLPGYCFAGYVTAAQYISQGTTTVTCCPSSFSFSSGSCIIGPTSSVRTVDGTPYVYYSTTYLPVTVVADTTSQVFVGSLRADPVVVAFQQAQLTYYTTSTSLISSIPPSNTAAAATQTSTQTPDSSSLSTGAKAGIGVGVAVGFFIFLALISWAVWLRRKQSQQKQLGGADEGHNKAELHGESRAFPELGQDSLHEVNGVAEPPEADANAVRAELEGDRRGWEAPTTN